MSGLNLLIVDPSEDFRLALEKMLQSAFSIHLSHNGRHALEYAKKIHPDIIIMDLMLTELDGLTLLSELHKTGLRPAVIIISRMQTDYVLEAAEELGIAYVMRKPCDTAAVVERVQDVSRHLQNKIGQPLDVNAYITDRLNLLCFSPRHHGYDFLREAVVLMNQDPGISITKELYPAVAEKCDTTPLLVERSIRTAINAAWERSGGNWSELPCSAFSGILSRPSNGVMIARLADEIRSKQDFQTDAD